jgi:hypothetical protein
MFGDANAHMRKNLGYHLDPEHADEFRSLLRRTGYKRFEEAVEVVKLQGWTVTDVGKRHKLLVRAMWDLMPAKTTKYRNPEAQRAMERQLELDREMMARIDAEP